MADLRAASLETLIQLVGVGLGITLVPALAMRGSLLAGTGVVVQPLAMADASRRISLVFRHGFPRCVALEALANVILANLPDTVKRIASSKRTKKKICRKR